MRGNHEVVDEPEGYPVFTAQALPGLDFLSGSLRPARLFDTVWSPRLPGAGDVGATPMPTRWWGLGGMLQRDTAAKGGFRVQTFAPPIPDLTVSDRTQGPSRGDKGPCVFQVFQVSCPGGKSSTPGASPTPAWWNLGFDG